MTSSGTGRGWATGSESSGGSRVSGSGTGGGVKGSAAGRRDGVRGSTSVQASPGRDSDLGETGGGMISRSTSTWGVNICVSGTGTASGLEAGTGGEDEIFSAADGCLTDQPRPNRRAKRTRAAKPVLPASVRCSAAVRAQETFPPAAALSLPWDPQQWGPPLPNALPPARASPRGKVPVAASSQAPPSFGRQPIEAIRTIPQRYCPFLALHPPQRSRRWRCGRVCRCPAPLQGESRDRKR